MRASTIRVHGQGEIFKACIQSNMPYTERKPKCLSLHSTHRSRPRKGPLALLSCRARTTHSTRPLTQGLDLALELPLERRPGVFFQIFAGIDVVRKGWADARTDLRRSRGSRGQFVPTLHHQLHVEGNGRWRRAAPAPARPPTTKKQRWCRESESGTHAV